MLHEGNEVQGKCGKQGLSIARGCIAVAMDQGDRRRLAARFILTNSSGKNLNSSAGPQGEGHDCMDAGGRAMQGAIAEDARSNSFRYKL